MYFKCDKEGYITRDCKGKQMIKRKVQKGSDDKDKKKEEGFSEDLE